MTELNSRQQQAEKTRLKIFECATSLFSEKTYEQVKISDICKKANVSVGNFYHHFKSKEDIINEGYRDFDIFIKEVWKNNAQSSTYDSIILLIRNQLEAISKNGHIYATHFFKNQLTNEVKYILDKNRFFYKTLAGVVRKGFDNHEFNDAYSVSEVTDTILRLSRGAIYDWCLHEGNYDVVEQGIKDISLILASFGLKSK